MNMNNKRVRNARAPRFKKRNGRTNNGNIARTRDQSLKKIDQYTSLARDARQNQDIIQYEYYMQHVDHYTRIVDEINELQSAHEQKNDRQNDTQVIEIDTSDADDYSDSDAAEDDDSSNDTSDIEVEASTDVETEAPKKRKPATPRKRKAAVKSKDEKAEDA